MDLLLPKLGRVEASPLQASGSKVAPAWDLSDRLSFPSLQGEVTVDVAIIGGGITGLAAAYALTERGLKVALLEAARLGEGSTGWCGGILSASTTVDLTVLEQTFGASIAQRILSDVTNGLERYRRLFPQAQWQTGNSVYLASRARHAKRMQQELSLHEKYRNPAHQLSSDDLAETWNGFHGGILVQNEHAINPVALVNAIAASLRDSGAKLFEQTRATAWSAKDGIVKVSTESGTIVARHLVIASGLEGFTEAERKRINSFLIPVTGHVIVTEPSAHISQMAGRGIIAAWDSVQLYHYVRYMQDGRMLIGGEEQPGIIPPQKMDAGKQEFRNLMRWAQRHHKFEIPEIQHAWRATLIVPADGLPFVQTRERDGSRIISVVTDGLPFAVTLADCIAGLVQTGSHWLTEPLSPQRRMPLAAQMASLVPRNKWIKSLIHKLTFKAIELYDRI